MMEQDDTILIQNILDGDKSAEGIFYAKYRKIVKDYITSKFTKYRTDDIDDLASVVMITVFENLSKYDREKSSVKSWILLITNHACIDNYRKNNRDKYSNDLTISFTDYSGSYFNCSCTAQPVFQNNISYSATNTFENNDTIDFISNQLSPTDFTLLNMKYVQGYNYNEIGSEFQLTSSTVSNKINYIKTKLKKSMSEDIHK